MKRFVLGLAAAAAISSAAFAQVAIKPGVPSILQWTPEQQKQWYPAIESVYRVRVIPRGKRVHPLPKARREIAPTWEHAGKRWSVDDYMAANGVSGVLVIKDGKILLERYGLGRKPKDRWTSFSVAKSVTSTLVGAAVQDGKLDLNAPVTRYLPELKGSAYEGATVRHLIMMSSGVKWNEDYTDPNSDVARSGGQAEKTEPGINPIVSYLRRLPRAAEPGTKFNYNTGETDLVGFLVSRATGKTLSAYASEKIWKPYGMERDAIWMLDREGHERGGCCMSMTLRDYGRVGQFILDGGKAGGKQILPPWWTADATKVQIANGQPAPAGYGYFWWIRDNGAYDASGIFGQSISTFRDERLIVVVNSAWPRATGRDLSAARTAFVDAVRNAVKTADTPA
ncbi:serine hydrolase [Phenylobacterium sp.]|jgi:CubicO group peptidase (beta-lactamase class C family)|uniref:serine hydrolase domain-containing protein n=1 Tax=Phenylobacterium sp. TaxID=1871053 RepID=UPI002F95F58D